MINVYKVVVGNTERMTPLGRSGRRWETNMRIDLNRVGSCGLDLSGSE
jgi:hypothetical protein